MTTKHTGDTESSTKCVPNSISCILHVAGRDGKSKHSAEILNLSCGQGENKIIKNAVENLETSLLIYPDNE